MENTFVNAIWQASQHNMNARFKKPSNKYYSLKTEFSDSGEQFKVYDKAVLKAASMTKPIFTTKNVNEIGKLIYQYFCDYSIYDRTLIKIVSNGSKTVKDIAEKFIVKNTIKDLIFKSNIKNIIICYDENAIKSIKDYLVLNVFIMFQDDIYFNIENYVILKDKETYSFKYGATNLYENNYLLSLIDKEAFDKQYDHIKGNKYIYPKVTYDNIIANFNKAFTDFYESFSIIPLEMYETLLNVPYNEDNELTLILDKTMPVLFKDSVPNKYFPIEGDGNYISNYEFINTQIINAFSPKGNVCKVNYVKLSETRYLSTVMFQHYIENYNSGEIKRIERQLAFDHCWSDTFSTTNPFAVNSVCIGSTYKIV